VSRLLLLPLTLRIAFVIYALSAGGAERVSLDLDQFTGSMPVSRLPLVTLDSWLRKIFYRIDARVKRIALGLTSESKNWREFIGNNCGASNARGLFFRSSEFDVVVSFMDNGQRPGLLATLGLGVPIVVTEQIDPRKHPIGRIRPACGACSIPSAGAVGGADSRD